MRSLSQRLFFALLCVFICTSSWSCGKKTEPGCDQAEVVPNKQTRVTVSREINSALLSCLFSIEDIINVDTNEDASGSFAIDFLSTGRVGDSCKTQVSIDLLSEDVPPGAYKATLRIDYDYSSDSGRISSFKHSEICITIPGDPSVDAGVGGSGGSTSTTGNAAGGDGTTVPDGGV
jgi:hypothetical protein